ncbi:hypothetical protein KXX34_008756 [Aspergillus fumigatus]|nr:hypothetical protein KXX34_008756 [Aspergillus fumigatus]
MIGPEPDHGGVRARQRHRLGTIGLTATWRWCNLLVHISPTLAFSFAVMPSCCWRYIAPHRLLHFARRFGPRETPPPGFGGVSPRAPPPPPSHGIPFILLADLLDETSEDSSCRMPFEVETVGERLSKSRVPPRPVQR